MIILATADCKCFEFGQVQILVVWEKVKEQMLLIEQQLSSKNDVILVKFKCLLSGTWLKLHCKTID